MGTKRKGVETGREGLGTERERELQEEKKDRNWVRRGKEPR